MSRPEEVEKFYLEHLPAAKKEKSFLKASCPFCRPDEAKGKGTVVVYLEPESFFMGYFRCLNRCRPG
jgi:hypothetical protein